MALPQRIESGSVDWFTIFIDLERAGYSVKRIALRTGIPRTTMIGWKNSGSEPKYADGEQLINFWSSITQKIPQEAPRKMSGNRHPS